MPSPNYSAKVVLGKSSVGPTNWARIAAKVLTQSSSDKRRRFKNEIEFLCRNKHKNIVTVVDYGLSTSDDIRGPFYVMPRYDGNAREFMGKVPPNIAFSHFCQIMDGIEAAHLQGVTHRDLKPENILFNEKASVLAIADFGIANFPVETVATIVKTGPSQRLANFQYAAPEQRVPGRQVSETADIYALGLMLNELFTGEVPHGTDFRSIASVVKEIEYLDDVVSR